MDFGGKGLVNINMTVPRGTSVTLTLEHVDKNGEHISHKNAKEEMVFETKDRRFSIDLSDYAVGTDTGVQIFIPYEITEKLASNAYVWNLLSYMDSETCNRTAYGNVRIVETYR